MGTRLRHYGDVAWRIGKSRTALIWAVLLIGLLTYFLVAHGHELDETWRTVRDAELFWLALLVGIELVIIAILTQTQVMIVERIGYKIPWLVQLKAQFQRIVVGTLSPVSGPASTVAYTRYMGQHGMSSADALLVQALNGVVGYGAFAIFLIPMLIFLWIEHETTDLILLAAIGLVAIIIAMVVGLALLLRPAGPPAWLARRVPAQANEFVEQMAVHKIKPLDLILPTLVAFTVELLGATLIYVALQAVDAEAKISIALAGYAVASLFMLVAPFFSGIGIVEVGLTIVLQQFGIPPGKALAATLLYRFADVWLPLILGLSMHVGSRPIDVRKVSVAAPAVFTALTGALTILAVIDPTHAHSVARYTGQGIFGLPELTRSFTLVTGFFLIVLSYSLFRRKRVAWVAAVALLTVSMVGHFAKGHDYLLAIITGFNLLLLAINKDRFRVRSDNPSVRAGVTRFIVALLVALAYGTVGFALLHERAFGRDFDLIEGFTWTLRAFFSLGNPELVPLTRYAAWFLDSITVVGVVALVYGLFSLIRPVVWKRTVYPEEQAKARALIQAHGNSSLDFFKYFDDKQFFFPSNGNGVVSYGVARGTAIVLGDPNVASDVDFQLVLGEFVDFCDANGWFVAFHQSSPRWQPYYKAAGLEWIKIGEDAIVEVEHFQLAGRHMKSMRRGVNKLEADGYKVIFHDPPQTNERLAALKAVSDGWLQLGGHRERGFTLGWWEDDYIRNSRVAAVEDADGKIYAFANEIFDGVPQEATIDMMRRASEPNGAMDFLFAKMFEYYRDNGYTGFSLGMAPFANVGTEPNAAVSERVLHEMYEHMNRVFSYKGLHAYKDKFSPRWEPRYLVFESAAALPLIALAIVRLTEEHDDPQPASLAPTEFPVVEDDDEEEPEGQLAPQPATGG